MLQTAIINLIYPVFPKAHNSKCQNLLFLWQIKQVNKSVKASLCIFIFFTLGTNGLGLIEYLLSFSWTFISHFFLYPR